MDDRDLVRSTLDDLRAMARLFERRQLSLAVLRIHFDRTATRLRLLDPEVADVVRSFSDLLERLEAPEVGAVIDRFDYWCRGAAA